MRQFIAAAVLISSVSMTAPVFAIGDLIGGDINFKGTVVAQGCSIVPSSKNIAVDFKEISTDILYREGRSSPELFVIELQNCSSKVLNSITVTFSGAENINLPGRLAITPLSTGSANGIGIGFEENDGTTILLNEPSKVVTITDSKMNLNFKAFVEGEPDALSKRALQTGAFRATANYTLNYQ